MIAISCTNLPACQTRDYFNSTTACVVPGYTQNVVPQWATLGNGNVRVCDSNNPASFPLPSPSSQACYCPPGQQLDQGSGQCLFCPTGTARSNQTSCQPCVRAHLLLVNLALFFLLFYYYFALSSVRLWDLLP